MMMSLFSVFDPVSYFGWSLNWVILFLTILVFPSVYFFVKSEVGLGFSMIKVSLGDVFKEVSFPNFKGLTMVSVVLFLYLSLINLVGLFPFTFSASGHLIVTLSVGLLMWGMSMFMGWVNSFESSSCHLVPEGSPLGLAPFMVVIESVSHLIRPLTLSVRLAANMMAGHLIIGLISSISMVSLSSFFVSVMLQSLMLVLEWAVCFIQAFVFSILVMLYALDFY